MSGVSGTYGIMAAVTTAPDAPTQLRRISRRAAAVAPSATLAVDAKAKALQAAGEHVIGFGAGEPDFPTPAHIVEAAVEACRDPANHRYTPTAGLPALREAIAAKTLRDSGYAVDGAAGAGDQRGQAGRRQRLRRAVRPRRRGPRPRPPYWTTYPESIAPGRRAFPVVVPTDERSGFRVDRRPARGGRHPADQGAAVRLAVQPDRGGATRGTRSRPSGAGRSTAASGC